MAALLMRKIPAPVRRIALAALVVAGLAPALAGCDMFGTSGGGELSPGLTASMSSPGASLDRATALDLINQYRGTVGASALTDDPSLDAQAQSLAATYAKNDKAPTAPSGIVGLRASAGYANFAETFSGWRNSPADAAVLASAQGTRAGIATVYDPNSTYGVYWILVLGA
ncbi:MAG TPA: CAP domain-containing protein [Devosiaceae bacterium]|nr:CAP domain-containing protein [Devosiaceae bacterium]